MITIDQGLDPRSLLPTVHRLFELSADKIMGLQETWDPGRGTPVFTVKGAYTSRGWTEWTQGFQFGSAILQYDATNEERFLRIGIEGTLNFMATHVSHVGVHDHGFNNVSTYGNILRLIQERRIPYDHWMEEHCKLALKVSGAIQAARWTQTGPGEGYIYSFNGPHSLFADTIRSLRSLSIAHQLGHVLMAEKDRKISLLERLLRHAETTARYSVYYGEGRDIYDVRGRVAHESIFNVTDGSYRCPGTQQGYSPFSTWTRGLAWIICGYAEQLEYLLTVPDVEFVAYGGKDAVLGAFLRCAEAASDFYIENTPTDGVPYWDTGAPGLVRMGKYLERASDPWNGQEPVDSSAAVIAAQGLLRLGKYLRDRGGSARGDRFFQAGLTVAHAVFSEPYLSIGKEHQGLILHSVYHRPNGWDYIPAGASIPCGEATMWGDYHARELALLLLRIAESKPYYAFFLRNPTG